VERVGCASKNTKIKECTNASEADTVCLESTSYHASTAIKKFPTDGAVTERVLTDTLYVTEFLPPIGRRGSKRLYDLVVDVCPEAGDIVRKAGREVGLDLGWNWNWNERECIFWI